MEDISHRLNVDCNMSKPTERILSVVQSLENLKKDLDTIEKELVELNKVLN